MRTVDIPTPVGNRVRTITVVESNPDIDGDHQVVRLEWHADDAAHTFQMYVDAGDGRTRQVALDTGSDNPVKQRAFSDVLALFMGMGAIVRTMAQASHPVEVPDDGSSESTFTPNPNAN